MNTDFKRYGLRPSSIFLILIPLILLAGCVSSRDARPEPLTTRVVNSVTVAEAPEIDGTADDMVWRKAEPLTLKTSPSEGIKTIGPDVGIRSVHTADRIFFLVTWKDSSAEDGVKYWEYDGTGWSRDMTGDRLSFLWNIDHSIREFDEKGCAGICHSEPGPHIVDEPRRMRADRDDVAYVPRGDVWKWAPGIMREYKTVSDGVFQATRLSPKSSKFVGEAVILFDNGEGGTKTWWTRNSRNPNMGTEDDPYPLWQLKPGVSMKKPPFPFQHEMEVIADYSVFKAGDTIPVILRFDLADPKNNLLFPNGKPEGSSIDITGQAKWDDGQWTLEISRLKDTKHKDDVSFTATKGKDAFYAFGVAVFLDDEPMHYTSESAALVLR